MSKEKIAERLKILRGDRTAKEVAEAIGITISALANYESGLRIPRDEIKAKIARYYGKSVDEIFFAA